MKTRNLYLVVPALLIGFDVLATPIGTIQDFSDGDTPTLSDGLTCSNCVVNGWVGESAPDQGADGLGDNAVAYDSEGLGFHFLTWEGYGEFADTAFLGNLLGAGVTDVEFQARHSGIGEDLFLRVFLFDDYTDGDVDFAYTNTGIFIPNTATEWLTYTISLDPLGMLTGGGNGRNAQTILSTVSQFGLRHDPDGDGPGNRDFVDSIAYFDDLRLITVPEPGTLALLAIGLFGIGLARRSKRV